MKGNTMGTLTILFGTLLALMLGGGRLAEATTVTELQASLNTEYSAGNMSTDAYQDLSLAVSNIKFENNIYDKEAFTIMVMAYSGNKIQSDAADRILVVADGL